MNGCAFAALGMAMHLSRIEIRNFRNLEACTVDLRQGLNVIVGRNNVGKSNLLSAIRHALGWSAARGDFLPPLSRDDFREPCNGKPAPIEVDLTFADLTDDDRIGFFDLIVHDLVDPAKSTAQIHFEAQWRADRGRVVSHRWGGPREGERAQVPNDALDAIPVTFLPALRDAEAALTPGYRSRLALLFRDIAKPEQEAAIVDVFRKANQDLEIQPLITDVKDGLEESTKKMAGSDFLAPSLGAAPPDFRRILRTLQVTLEDGPVGDLACSGLGYQNLLYIATVLAHLRHVAKDDCPLLLVEEPEAHLHPQLVVLLAKYFAGTEPGASVPQTIVTTHSPMLAAHVEPKQLHVMHEPAGGSVCCSAVAKAGLDEKEERALQRMMDVTRSALYFAKGAILVEGVSEALLLPALARLLGHDLRDAHVSVIPICGVSFRTFERLLRALRIPVAIVTDSDPPITYPGTDESKEDESGPPKWRNATPAAGTRSPRAQAVVDLFDENVTVSVHCSTVTLEYDLAFAGPKNPPAMVEQWVSTFAGTPQTLNKKELDAAGDDLQAQALTVWRGICVAKHSGSKAEFAHLLAEHLETVGEAGFAVPAYIRDAIEFVMGKVGGSASGTADA